MWHAAKVSQLGFKPESAAHVACTLNHSTTCAPMSLFWWVLLVLLFCAYWADQKWTLETLQFLLSSLKSSLKQVNCKSSLDPSFLWFKSNSSPSLKSRALATSVFLFQSVLLKSCSFPAAISTGSVMKGCPVLSQSSGPRGAPGQSAALSAGEASIPGSAPARMETAAQDVHW